MAPDGCGHARCSREGRESEVSTSGFRVPRWLSAALLAVTLGLLAWMVVRDRPALNALGDIAPADVATIMILQVLYLIPESYRQQIVIESSSDTTLRWLPWFRIFIVGRFLNTMIPQSGNVYRGLRLRSDFGVALAEFGGGMAAFVIMSVVASLLVAAPFLAWQSPSLTVAGIPTPLALLIAAAMIGGAPFAIWAVLGRRTVEAGSTSRIVATARSVVSSTMTALSDLRLMVAFLVVWLLTITVVVALYRTVFAAIGWNLGIGEAIAIYALLQASSFLVLTPGNLGIQELGMAALAAIFGIPAAVGVVAAGIIRVTGWIAIAIPAAVFGSGDITRFVRSTRAAKE